MDVDVIYEDAPVEKVVLELDIEELQALAIMVNRTPPAVINDDHRSTTKWTWPPINKQGVRDFSAITTPLKDAYREIFGKSL
jgi:hypothetical protein